MMMQRDNSGLTTENKELKLRLQALEQQAHLRDGMPYNNLRSTIFTAIRCIDMCVNNFQP